MDCRGPAPVQKICLREAPIFQPAPAQEVESAIRQSGVNKRRSCIYQMAILALTGAQILRRPLAISDVDYSSCEFDEIARGAENRMTNAVNVPDGATRMHNAIIHFFVKIFMLGPVGRFPERRLIVGMNSLDEFFGSGQTIPWVKTRNALAFFRPMPDVGLWTPSPP